MPRYFRIPELITLILFLGLSVSTSNAQYVHNPDTISLADLNAQAPPPFLTRTPANIVEAFLKSETKVREALNQHTFKRDVVLQTIGPNGEVTGEYIRHSQFLFDDHGNRIERVTFHPPSTIREMRITKEDIQDLAGAQLLGIDITESSKYSVTFVREETFAARRVYLLNVEPSVRPDPNRMRDRFFVGQIWVDVEKLQILKVSGTVKPDGKQRFPLFETFREPFTANLYLPVRTDADDVLHFPKRDVTYRIRVKYYDYKLFASKLTITELNEPGN